MKNRKLEIVNELKGNDLLSEKNIKYVLTERNLNYIKELSIRKLHTMFDTTKNDSLASKRFDYVLPQLNLVIEFDGDQHFKAVNYFGGNTGHINRQVSDLEKMNYLIENEINLIRIKTGSTVSQLRDVLNDYEPDELGIFYIEPNKSVTIDRNPKLLDVQSTLDSQLADELMATKDENAKLLAKIKEQEDEIKSLNGKLQSKKTANSDLITDFLKDCEKRQLFNLPSMTEELLYILYQLFVINSGIRKLIPSFKEFSSELSKNDYFHQLNFIKTDMEFPLACLFVNDIDENSLLQKFNANDQKILKNEFDNASLYSTLYVNINKFKMNE